MEQLNVSYTRYEEGDAGYDDYSEKIFNAGQSYRCPTYVNRTPPCQTGCPSGHDVRTWLNIIAKRCRPGGDMSLMEFAFRTMVNANPFPAVMGLTCTAPCQNKCNRAQVDEAIGINSIEHYVGMWAIEEGIALDKPEGENGVQVAVVGSGPGGLSAAYQLRRMGYGVTLFEAKDELGGVFNDFDEKKCPKAVVEAEIKRIIDTGIIVKTGSELSGDFAAVYWSDLEAAPEGDINFAPEKAPNADLPTTQIGQGWRAARNIDGTIRKLDKIDVPRFDVRLFDMEAQLAERDKAPAECPEGWVHNTGTEAFSIHNYEDRSRDKMVSVKDLFLGHFKDTPRFERQTDADGMLVALTNAEAIKETRRCMSCGMCFECSLCIQYCPMDAISREKKDDRSYGRFVVTDYSLCIGCQICKDVCPTGYIQMGLE